jgi:alpha-amylase
MVLPKLILTRRMYAYGTQIDYFDKPGCIGFTRLGHPSQSSGAGLAVIISNGWEVTEKRMNVGKHHSGELWTDTLRWCWGEVVIDEHGWGVFRVGPRSVSVWASKTALGRERLNELVLLASPSFPLSISPPALLPTCCCLVRPHLLTADESALVRTLS